MKYVILLGDGMADHPIEKLGGKRPWNTPGHRTWIGSPVRHHRARGNHPERFSAGSDVANLTVLGMIRIGTTPGAGPWKRPAWHQSFSRAMLPSGATSSTWAWMEKSGWRISPPDTFPPGGPGGHRRSERGPRFGNGSVLPRRGLQAPLRLEGRPGFGEDHTPHDITGQEIAGYLPAGDGSAPYATS